MLFNRNGAFSLLVGPNPGPMNIFNKIKVLTTDSFVRFRAHPNGLEQNKCPAGQIGGSGPFFLGTEGKTQAPDRARAFVFLVVPLLSGELRPNNARGNQGGFRALSCAT